MYHREQCVSWGEQTNESLNFVFEGHFQHKHQHCSFKNLRQFHKFIWNSSELQITLELCSIERATYCHIKGLTGILQGARGQMLVFIYVYRSTKMKEHKLIFDLSVKLLRHRKINCLFS